MWDKGVELFFFYYFFYASVPCSQTQAYKREADKKEREICTRARYEAWWQTRRNSGVVVWQANKWRDAVNIWWNKSAGNKQERTVGGFPSKHFKVQSIVKTGSYSFMPRCCFSPQSHLKTVVGIKMILCFLFLYFVLFYMWKVQHWPLTLRSSFHHYIGDGGSRRSSILRGPLR